MTISELQTVKLNHSLTLKVNQSYKPRLYACLMQKFNATKTFGRMREFVLESGVTDPRQIISTIADACDVSYQAVAKWKEGTTKTVTMPPINNFCDKYGANPDYISSGYLPRTRAESGSEELQELVQRFLAADKDGRQFLLQSSRLIDKKDTG